METNKMYRVEFERHIWKDGNLKEVVNMGNSFYTTLNAARKHAENLHADGMRIHRETKNEPETQSTEIWVNEYELIGEEFFYKELVGHFTSHDICGLVLSHCD